MARIITTKGKVIEVTPKNGTDFSLEELQYIVGGIIEIVSTGAGLMVLNEYGKLLGLDINQRATEIYGRRDIIVGDVLVCSSDEIK